jgi:putative membrane protein
MSDDSNRARDHLANERTFLAWVRTGVAVVVFGFAIGRFSIAIRQFSLLQGKEMHTSGLAVWMGLIGILAGVILTIADLVRYRRIRSLRGRGAFEPAGFVIDLVAMLTSIFGLGLGAYYRNGIPVNYGQ